jgi:hypothetical protein
MRLDTREIQDSFQTIGRRLGFEVREEVSNSVLALRLDKAYQPRVDLMWSLDLRPAQSQALSKILDQDASGLINVPLVGIEIEGTAPTTKTLLADVANIAALGVRLGFLVVSEKGEKNIYRRSVRAIRTLRRAFGDMAVVPFEASWMESLVNKEWDQGLARIPVQASRAPAGGETLEFSRDARSLLRKLGEDAGFKVAEPYVPQILTVDFEEERSRRGGALLETLDPITGTVSEMKAAGDYLTRCQIDLAWLLPLPKALKQFLQEVQSRDPQIRNYGLLYSEIYDHVAVVGFELESGGGKHAAGGLLNLAAYCVVGVGITPDERSAKELESILRRYRPTLGLRGVRINDLPTLRQRSTS